MKCKLVFTIGQICNLNLNDAAVDGNMEWNESDKWIRSLMQAYYWQRFNDQIAFNVRL